MYVVVNMAGWHTMTRYIIFLVSTNANLPTCIYDSPKFENFEKFVKMPWKNNYKFLNFSIKYRISSYRFRPWIVSAAKIQFYWVKNWNLRHLFKYPTISKFKKEYFPRKLYEEIQYSKFKSCLTCTYMLIYLVLLNIMSACCASNFW